MSDNGDHLSCATCSAKIGDLEACAVYRKTETEIQLIIKPVYRSAVLESATIKFQDDEPDKKGIVKTRVLCCKCENRIGIKSSFGPKGMAYIGLGYDKVHVGARHRQKNVANKKAMKWTKLWQERFFDGFIDVRTEEDFYPTSTAPMVQVSREDPPIPPLVIPSKPEHFEWEDLMYSDRVPRDYQVR